MIVDCPSCGATYNISDDKVRGRRVRVRCKSCGEGIIVDGAQLDADDATRVYSPSFEPAAYGGELGNDDSTRVMSSGDFEPGAGEWTVNLSDTEQRTMTLDELASGYNSGLVGDDAFVWKDGMADWLPLLEVPEIRAAVDGAEATRVVSPAVAVRSPLGPRGGAAPRAAAPPTPVTYSAPAAPPRARQNSDPMATVEFPPLPPSSPPPYVPPPTPPPVAYAPPPAPVLAPARTAAPAARAAPPARRREGRPRGPDLFGNPDTAGGEAALLSSSSLPLAQYDEKPIGARNENSVLFSLDTLKAGVGKGGRAAGAPSRGAVAAPPTAADILGMSAAGALPGMDTTTALLSAPAVEAPPPPSASAAASAALPPPRSRMDTTPPAARGKPPVLLIAVVLGAVAVLGAAAFVLKSRMSSAPTVTQGVVPATAAAEPPKAAAPAPQVPTTQVATAAPATAAPAAPPPAAAPVAAAPVQAAPAAPQAAPAPRSGGGSSSPSIEAMKAALREPKQQAPAEAKPEAAPAGKLVLAETPSAGGEAPAAEPKPEEAAKPPFDTGAAKVALETASSSAPSCKKPDGPTGRGKVQVTFSPSGRATSANVIEGPFGGTPVGGCVAKLFRAAKVPPFTGDPVTVSKSFTIPE